MIIEKTDNLCERTFFNGNCSCQKCVWLKRISDPNLFFNAEEVHRSVVVVLGFDLSHLSLVWYTHAIIQPAQQVATALPQCDRQTKSTDRQKDKKTDRQIDRIDLEKKLKFFWLFSSTLSVLMPTSCYQIRHSLSEIPNWYIIRNWLSINLLISLLIWIPIVTN